ncbi:MAG TPA: prepilin-type N-terminal cleavage/methylation domain-containing protein [Longimicrobiales bacterium]|nr:prepilin-type N-terminal cleavage/methylation domain-containing protein [Longimicrobiales bacterium]
MRPGRRGFTLVEILVVVVLGSLVVLAALQVLLTNQRTYTAQNAVINGQQSTRMALEVLFNELRELSPAGGDILAMGQDSLRVRLMRKFSIVCDVSVGGSDARLTVLRLPGRRFAPNDSVFVFADNNERDDDDDVWIRAQVSDTAETTCPQDGLSAARLEFEGQADLFTADSVGAGAPVRSHDHFTFGLTTFEGDPYLGRRQRAEPMVPIAGPLRAGTGIEFVYRDRFGTVTAMPADVRQVVVRVRSGSGVLNSRGQQVSDSVTAWVYARN